MLGIVLVRLRDLGHVIARLWIFRFPGPLASNAFLLPPLVCLLADPSPSAPPAEVLGALETAVRPAVVARAVAGLAAAVKVPDEAGSW